MDPVKMARVCDWPTPKNCTNLQIFLGFTNFYQKFIYGFSEIAHPLFNLTESNSIWIWATSQQDSSDLLKIAINFAPVLTSPNIFTLFWIEVDSLDFTTRAVLSQESRTDSKWHSVSFFSKSLSPIEYNYKIYNKKILAIICML